MVIGAVAWITDLDILEALSRRQTLLVIQKEDFLRPDMESRLSNEAKQRLHTAYSQLKPFDGTKVSVGPFFQFQNDIYQHLNPIQCFGFYSEKEMFRTPRMHNKFLVFLYKKEKLYYPQKVWTGSLNLTQLSMHSLENAVLISDENIAAAYAEEAQNIYLNSEELNWKNNWINPFLKK